MLGLLPSRPAIGARSSIPSAQTSEQIGRSGGLCRGVTKCEGKRSSTQIVAAIWVSPVLDKELDHLRATVAYRVVQRGFALVSASGVDVHAEGQQQFDHLDIARQYRPVNRRVAADGIAGRRVGSLLKEDFRDVDVAVAAATASGALPEPSRASRSAP